MERLSAGVNGGEDGGQRPSAFELDILGQSAALRRFLQSPRPDSLTSKPVDRFDRVLVTGMGASHFAGLRTWRRLVAAGLPAWWIDTAELVGSLELVTPSTLLIVTSQSGASGEIVALLDALRDRRIQTETIAITNAEESALARTADVTLLLHSGPEATVSTKTYINSLAAHEHMTACLLDRDRSRLSDELRRGVQALDRPDKVPQEVAVATVAAEVPRIALVGDGDHAATALFGALIIKEGAKLPAEGFLAGNFRHGPLELAGPGLTALFCGVRGGEDGEPFRRLASEVADTDSRTLTLGSAVVAGCEPIAGDLADGFPGLALGALVCQRFTVDLARALGIEPGAFRYGQKVTLL